MDIKLEERDIPTPPAFENVSPPETPTIKVEHFPLSQFHKVPQINSQPAAPNFSNLFCSEKKPPIQSQFSVISPAAQTAEFVCSDCGKPGLAGHDALEGHLVADHMGWFRFQCPYCPVGFPRWATKLSLWHHIMLNHPRQPFKYILNASRADSARYRWLLDRSSKSMEAAKLSQPLQPQNSVQVPNDPAFRNNIPSNSQPISRTNPFLLPKSEPQILSLEARQAVQLTVNPETPKLQLETAEEIRIRGKRFRAGAKILITPYHVTFTISKLNSEPDRFFISLDDVTQLLFHFYHGTNVLFLQVTEDCEKNFLRVLNGGTVPFVTEDGREESRMIGILFGASKVITTKDLMEFLRNNVYQIRIKKEMSIPGETRMCVQKAKEMVHSTSACCVPNCPICCLIGKRGMKRKRKEEGCSDGVLKRYAL